jgi:hypothetical protein
MARTGEPSDELDRVTSYLDGKERGRGRSTIRNLEKEGTKFAKESQKKLFSFTTW